MHFLQIWIMPGAARASRRATSRSRSRDASSAAGCGSSRRATARDGSVRLHQDADLYAGVFEPGESTTFASRDGRKLWVQVARGRVALDGTTLAAGDGAALAGAGTLEFTALERAEILLFDMAP